MWLSKPKFKRDWHACYKLAHSRLEKKATPQPFQSKYEDPVSVGLWSMNALETGAYGGEATPVPIPNTAVKLSCGDDTGNPGKVAQCRIEIIHQKTTSYEVVFDLT